MVIFNADDNRCIICGPNVPTGLKVAFENDGQGVRAEITVPDPWQGFTGLVHGGILAGLLDDAMWHAIYQHGNFCTMTAELTVRYHNPVPLKTPLIVRGQVLAVDRRLTRAKAHIESQGQILVSATGRFMPPKGAD